MSQTLSGLIGGFCLLLLGMRMHFAEAEEEDKEAQSADGGGDEPDGGPGIGGKSGVRGVGEVFDHLAGKEGADEHPQA